MRRVLRTALVAVITLGLILGAGRWYLASVVRGAERLAAARAADSVSQLLTARFGEERARLQEAVSSQTAEAGALRTRADAAVARAARAESLAKALEPTITEPHVVPVLNELRASNTELVQVNVVLRKRYDAALVLVTDLSRALTVADSTILSQQHTINLYRTAKSPPPTTSSGYSKLALAAKLVGALAVGIEIGRAIQH